MKSVAACRALSAAARIIATPPAGVQHEDAEPGGLAHGAGYGVLDVVKLHVEEHAKVELTFPRHAGGAGRGEWLRADLAAGDYTA